MSDPNYPLHGLKVLDFSRVLAGPFAGRMMSDLGADVVKVEPPDNDIPALGQGHRWHPRLLPSAERRQAQHLHRPACGRRTQFRARAC